MNISNSAACAEPSVTSQHEASATIARTRRRWSITRDLLAGAPHADEPGACDQLELLELVDAVVAVRRDVQHAGIAALDHELVDVAIAELDVGEQPIVGVFADLVVLEGDRLVEHELTIEVARLRTEAVVLAERDLRRVDEQVAHAL